MMIMMIHQKEKLKNSQKLDNSELTTILEDINKSEFDDNLDVILR